MDSKHIFPVLEELFPGIPNDVALYEIATKLSWRYTDTLSSVTPCWRKEIRSREVYDARVRHNSTETLAVVHISSEFISSDSESAPENNRNGQLFLYSLRDKSLHRLPPMPVLLRGFEFVAFDGRLYVLGGVNPHLDHHEHQSVYVLDVAGERQWKRCASMLEPRRFFGCDAMNGRIYVFGGCSTDGGMTPLCGCEMYDPKVDAWSPITPMSSGRMNHGVVCTGEKLLVHGGFAIDFDIVSTWQIYDPLKNDWREVRALYRIPGLPFNIPVPRQVPFMWQGNMYSVLSDGIYVYDKEQNALTYRYSRIACDGLRPIDSVDRLSVLSVLPVKNKLLAMVLWKKTDSEERGGCLLECSGFGGKDDVVWSRASSTFRVPGIPDLHTSMCSIQL